MWRLVPSLCFKSKKVCKKPMIEKFVEELTWNLLHTNTQTYYSWEHDWKRAETLQNSISPKNCQNLQFVSKHNNPSICSCVSSFNHPNNLPTWYLSDPGHHPCTVTPLSSSAIFVFKACRLTWIESSRNFQSTERVGTHSGRFKQAQAIFRPS